MALSKLIFVGNGKAVCCTVVSACGILFLVVLGLLFQAESEILLEGKPGEAPSSGKVAARGCFGAAIIYVGFFAFCFFQSWLHSRRRRLETRFTGL